MQSYFSSIAKYSCVFNISIGLLLAGCSFSYQPYAKDENEEVLATTDNDAPSSAPFRVDLKSEINDGSNLIVKGLVTAKAKADPAKAIIKLSALDNEGVTQQANLVIKDALLRNGTIAANASKEPLSMNAGQSVEFVLQIPSKDITNYQIEVLWGNDAVAFLRDSAKPADQFVALRNLEIERLKNTNCDFTECAKSVRLSGQVFNSGNSSVARVVLGVGFIMAPQGSSVDLAGQIPENERRVEIRNITLEPGDSKSFRFVMKEPEDKSALSDWGENLDQETTPWKPTVRIVSFDTSSSG